MYVVKNRRVCDGQKSVVSAVDPYCLIHAFPYGCFCGDRRGGADCEIMATDASGVTVPFSTEPEATYSLAKYPVLTVAAISNYFGRIDAEYNEFTREFTVVYMLKSSKRLLSTDWTLTYDADLLTLDPEKNTIETICPIMKKVANMSVDDKKGVIRYAATDLDMFDFSTAEAAFVRIVFDVPRDGA